MQNAYAMKSSLFSRNVAWCLQVKHTLVREISQLIWTIYSVLFNFPFQINMTTLNNALQNSPTSSWADITITIFNLASWAGVFFEFSGLLLFSFFAPFKQAEVNVRWALWNKHGDREGTIFFSSSTPRACLFRPALGSCSPEKH